MLNEVKSRFQSGENIAKLIDHTLLKPTATKTQLIKLCAEAKEYGFASVCVNPTNVTFCVEQLKASNVPVCTVIGFPLGATSTLAKFAEVKHSLQDGATEFDMVINIGALKDGDYETVHSDIYTVVKAAEGNIVKVIIETCLLTDDEKIAACTIAKKAGAHFVKTSTGFSTGGATVEDIKLMRATVGEKMGVKASGGIKTLADVETMIEAGATRIGASAGVEIVRN